MLMDKIGPSGISLIITPCNMYIMILPKSKELTRGTTELVQHFCLWGSSHRPKSAAWHKFDLVWLYNSCLSPVGRRGVVYSFQLFLPAFIAIRGGGGQHSVDTTHILYVPDWLCYNMMFQAINKETFCEAVKAAQECLGCFFKLFKQKERLIMRLQFHSFFFVFFIAAVSP
jgi:hypothetical protein